VWLPRAVPRQFPLLACDPQEQEWSPDLHNCSWRVLLAYAEPHTEGLADVPDLQRRAAQALLRLTQLLLHCADTQLIEPLRIRYFRNAGPDRLGGAQAQLTVAIPVAPAPPS
jgi:hypothetical protein